MSCLSLGNPRRGLFVGKPESVATNFNQIELKFILNAKSPKIPVPETIRTQQQISQIILAKQHFTQSGSSTRTLLIAKINPINYEKKMLSVLTNQYSVILHSSDMNEKEKYIIVQG